MGILDEAIKEHLELKRQHGAGESELKQLEDEAFGAAERPGDEQPADGLSEAPTAFMAQPEVPGEDAAEASVEGSGGKRRPAPQIADLQEPPEAEVPPSKAEASAEPQAPTEEEAPAMEHEAVAEPEPDAEPIASPGHSTEERQAIAEQPTEMYDVEEELAGQEPAAPSEEQLVEQEVSEPRLAPVDPLASVEEAEGAEVEVTDARGEEADDFDDDFWDEKRLSDELDQALDAPLESEAPPEPETSAEPAVPEPEEQKAVPQAEAEKAPSPEHEDLLEDTPDFLEEAPEDDQLWFEQKPPKDFDFDD
jgi:hypothetical protein